MNGFKSKYFSIAMLVFASFGASAKNFGNVAPVYPIGEVDMLDWIYARLKGFEESGKLDELKDEMQSIVRQKVRQPNSFTQLTETSSPETFYVDPSRTLAADIKDADGNVIYPKGTKVNPFDPSTWNSALGEQVERFTLNKTLVFIDATKPMQVEWVKHFESMNEVKIYLVDGSPIETSNQIGKRVYFDQLGTLERQLKLQHAPSVVEQDGFYWKVKEINPYLGMPRLPEVNYAN